MNLIENAAKYGSPPVEVAASIEGDQLVFSVTDHGPGIAPADRERVLAPFARLDWARTPGSTARGYGLGLTLARRIAEAHGGRIAIGSLALDGAHEIGCRVALILPLRSSVTSRG